MSLILFKASVPFVLYIAAFSYAQTCYTPDGKAVDRSWGDLPCNSTATHRMCCKLDRSGGSNNRDSCLPNGLCAPSDNFRPFRGPCTDPTWKDPACIQLCTQGLDPFGQPYNATVGIPLTYCADGSFCCETNYTVSAANDGSEDCCKQKGGLFLMNREPTTATPSPSGTIAAPTTAAASTQPTATGTASSSPASSPVSKSTNTGAIIGGVVGGIAAVAILSLAFWFFMIRRVVKQTAQPSSHAQAPYDKSRQQMWQEPKEVPGNEFRGELAAAAMTAELDTRQNR